MHSPVATSYRNVRRQRLQRYDVLALLALPVCIPGEKGRSGAGAATTAL
ncbi:hypothetical protein V1291_002296 [Nitrobacteraceae bacterium AZCC 1564]